MPLPFGFGGHRECRPTSQPAPAPRRRGENIQIFQIFLCSCPSLWVALLAPVPSRGQAPTPPGVTDPTWCHRSEDKPDPRARTPVWGRQHLLCLISSPRMEQKGFGGAETSTELFPQEERDPQIGLFLLFYPNSPLFPGQRWAWQWGHQEAPPVLGSPQVQLSQWHPELSLRAMGWVTTAPHSFVGILCWGVSAGLAVPRAVAVSPLGDLAVQRDRSCRDSGTNTGINPRDSCSPSPPQFVGADRAAAPRGRGGCGIFPIGQSPPGRAAAARSRWGKLQPFAFLGAAASGGFGCFQGSAAPWQLRAGHWGMLLQEWRKESCG